MSSKARLIECIDNIIIDEQNYIKEKATDLKNKGYTVLDLHLSRDKHMFINDTDWLKLVKNIQLRDFKTADPEYGFVLGAFGAFGNPHLFQASKT